MAMLPFAGYDMGEYFGHWLKMGKNIKFPPHIFHVNWFRKDKDGNFLWPGFGDNMRVLKWIVERCEGTAAAYETAVGNMPLPDQFDMAEMEGFGPAEFEAVQKIDKEEWKKELLLQTEFFLSLNRTLPKELVFERELLASRVC